ncbi:NUDIX domain-containing protein [Chloroflexota bacterium]
MQTVECRTLYNETKQVPVEDLEVRPSVYGLIIHEGQILLALATYSQKLVLPGGGIDKGEPILVALKREVWEETGLTVQVGQFLHFEEDFFYYDPLDMAIHGYLFYYHCQPLTFDLPSIEYPPEEGLDRPLWVDIATLEPASFQAHGATTLRLIQQLA